MKISHRSLYNIKPGLVYDAGRLENGNQIVMGIQFPEIVLVEFDADGNYLGYETVPIQKEILAVSDGVYRADPIPLSIAIRHQQEELGLIKGPISVRPFFVPERWIGIKPLPDHYQDILDHADPDSQEWNEVQEEARLWQDRGDFVFYWDEPYYLNRDGDIESS